jgi:hypothetical protein
VPKITAAFAEANGCDFGGNLPRPTRWDGFREFSCNRPHGDCGASAVVQCVGRWGHTWPLSWFKMASTLFDDIAPSASLACLKARAAPTHPGAQPEHLGGLPWPQD